MFRAILAAAAVSLVAGAALAAPVELRALRFASTASVPVGPGGVPTDLTISLTLTDDLFGFEQCGDSGVIGCSLNISNGTTGSFTLDAGNDLEFGSFATEATAPFTQHFAVSISALGSPLPIGTADGIFAPIAPGTTISHVVLDLTENTAGLAPGSTETLNTNFDGTFRIFGEDSIAPIPLPASGALLIVAILGPMGLRRIRRSLAT